MGPLYRGQLHVSGEECYMGKVTVEQILAEAKTLSHEEQQQLRDTLDAWLRSERPEEQLERVLYDAGLRRDIRLTGVTTDSSPRHPPVHVSGRPVSETLIEERR